MPSGVLIWSKLGRGSYGVNEKMRPPGLEKMRRVQVRKPCRSTKTPHYRLGAFILVLMLPARTRHFSCPDLHRCRGVWHSIKDGVEQELYKWHCISTLLCAVPIGKKGVY